MSIPKGSYTFESVQFPGVYLRMDGNGVTKFAGPGGGVVNNQFGAGPWEKFCLEPNPSSPNIYTIQSVQFPGVYLRMDGGGVTKFAGSGGGVVNCQFGAGPYEQFKIIYNGSDGSFSIESNAFSGVYMRMDGNGVTKFTGPGGGVVNCQFGAGPWEKFTLRSVC